MQNFNWEVFRQGSIAVHCDTEEKANDFLKCFYNAKTDYIYKNNYDNFWDEYKENTCYFYDCIGDGNCFSDINYLKEEGYKIMKWEEEV